MLVNNIIRPIYRTLRGTVLQSLLPCSQAEFNLDRNSAIEVIGFFESFSGIGESARLCATSLKEAGYKVKCTSVESVFRKKSDAPWVFENAPADTPIGTRIFHLNPPMMPPVILSMGIKDFRKTFNIGYWAWELSELPKEWVRGIRYMNAIMTPSDFTSQTIRKYTNKAVETVLHPVSIDKTTINPDMRAKLEIAQDSLLFSTIFSFGSAMERKNPEAVIKAFQTAFTPQDNAVLVLKSNSGSPENKAALEKLFGEHKNIRLCDGFWPREDTQGLIAASDLYISLHRSEGFGLTIAEAMLMDVPVMVTNWSGNTDFCTKENAFLVGYNQVPVRSTHPEFKGLGNLTWADADVNEAARILQDIKSDRAKLDRMKETVRHSLVEILSRKSYQTALQRLKDGKENKE
ncbi:MAG: glycosyltransferase family 4 protein [Pseudobdellovibrionaceae bacterium]|nr:glycosyltransferase family 4 protein [Pseudobdellovibrionaceae bacterium]